jgi:chemotaxis protein MotB
VSAGGFSDRRRGGGGGGGEHAGPDERWLVSYADMLTLLFAVFVVLFAMSAVNKSKFETLQESLRAAFSGQVTSGNKVMPGGPSVMSSGAAAIQGVQTAKPMMPTQPEFSIFGKAFQAKTPAQAHEQESLKQVQKTIEEYARDKGLSEQIRTTLDERGLVIRLMTDKLLFDSGSAVLNPAATPVLREVASLLTRTRIGNPVRVEGNTDSTPIRTAAFPSNWELSAARAGAVLRELAGDGVAEGRLSLAGYADEHPIAPNTTAAGRASNRRVEIVVLRTTTSSSTSSTPSGGSPIP